MITTLRRPVIKRCPFRDEIDAGELVITLRGPAPELHQLAEQIDRLAAAPISHEDFTEQVAILLPMGSRLETTWRTGPWSVEVRADAS